MYEELKERYFVMKQAIEQRLAEFEEKWRAGNDEMLFEELIFCLMTPQSKAKACWNAVRRIVESGAAIKGEPCQLNACMSGVRFRNNKSRYIVLARKLFSENGRLSIRKILEPVLAHGAAEARNWLVANVKGFGYKEASHFLRNIGFGAGLAILDRHILKNMVKFGIIKSVPETLNREKYLEIEDKLREFSKKVKIPLSHIDLLFWSAETGEIFK